MVAQSDSLSNFGLHFSFKTLGKVNCPGFTAEQNSPKVDLRTQKKYTLTYLVEIRERGRRLFKENRSNYSSDNAAYNAI